MSIQILASDVIDQIAAGEVVERPSHLVKELIENSLDAGASVIEVEFEQGGRRVRVVDNGAGMSPEDLRLALARHATSKISKADDLWSLNSFGFRGEALASISAVSRVSLVSRTQNSNQGQGAQIRAEFGRVSEVEPIGTNLGTSILIEDLFANVPARLKFLKSEAAETTQIKTVLKALALAHPAVEFRVRAGGKHIFLWERSEDPRARAERVLETQPLYTHRIQQNGFDVEVFYASPTQVVGHSRQIWIFVQGRWVQDRSLQAAVLDAYRSLLMHGEYPIAAVRLRCPADEIDVNIHPTKSQVKFRDPQMAFRSVHRCLREGLEAAPWLKTSFAPQTTSHAVTSTSALLVQEGPKESSRENLSFSDPALVQVQYHKPNLSQLRSSAEARSELAATLENSKLGRPSETVGAQGVGPWSRLQVIGQAHLTYILAESEDSFFLIDQHAAHERVVFESLMARFRSGGLERQGLLVPITVDFDADVLEALLQHSADLSRMGIELEALGPTTALMRSVPALVKEAAAIETLKQFASEVSVQGASFALEKKISDLFATMACHSVIRAGHAMAPEQMRGLLRQMDEFAFSSFCPHGRPVSIEIPFKKIEKDFGRLG